jgi:hypothetical protein
MSVSKQMHSADAAIAAGAMFREDPGGRSIRPKPDLAH